MKFTIFVIFCIQTALIAQTNSASDYVVTTSGDTLYGKVKHIDDDKFWPKFYKKIRFTNLEGKRKKYRKKDVSAFRANNIDYERFWLNQTSEKFQLVNPKYDIDRKNGDIYFLRVISRGRLSSYHLEWFVQDDDGFFFMDLLKKENDQFFIRPRQGLFGLKRKLLSSYFRDCEALVRKIELKEIKKVDAIVDYYNKNCD